MSALKPRWNPAEECEGVPPDSDTLFDIVARCRRAQELAAEKLRKQQEENFVRAATAVLLGANFLSAR